MACIVGLFVDTTEARAGARGAEPTVTILPTRHVAILVRAMIRIRAEAGQGEENDARQSSASHEGPTVSRAQGPIKEDRSGHDVFRRGLSAPGP